MLLRVSRFRVSRFRVFRARSTVFLMPALRSFRYNAKSVPFGTLFHRHSGIVSVEVLLRCAEETHIVVTRYVLIQSTAPALCMTHLTEDTTIR